MVIRRKLKAILENELEVHRKMINHYTFLVTMFSNLKNIAEYSATKSSTMRVRENLIGPSSAET